jgi:hypothetical protein
MDPDSLVRDYLARLEAAAAVLPADRRTELVDDIREHIDCALAEADPMDEAAVRNTLERLGSPNDIVAAEGDGPPATPDSGRTATRPAIGNGRALSVETKALLLLTLGALVLPFIGPILGLWFVSASSRWSLTQKRTAALMVLILLVMPAVLIIPALVSGELTWVVTSGGFALPFIPMSGLVAAAYLVASSTWVLTVSRRP